MNTNCSDYTNILIIGCGGAGLSSAIEANKNNLSVKVLGKRPKNDAHTVLAAGGINASFGNLDNNDSFKLRVNNGNFIFTSRLFSILVIKSYYFKYVYHICNNEYGH